GKTPRSGRQPHRLRRSERSGPARAAAEVVRNPRPADSPRRGSRGSGPRYGAAGRHRRPRPAAPPPPLQHGGPIQPAPAPPHVRRRLNLIALPPFQKFTLEGGKHVPRVRAGRGPKIPMAQREFTIQNKLGIHARPAAQFVKTASRFQAEVRVEKDGEEVDG